MAGAVAELSSVPRAHELSSIGRARQIAAVLARNHLWHLIELLALEHLVPFERRAANGPGPSALITPLQLRTTLEELGPTFMKLGQVLSTRADVMPPEFRAELSKLQDRAPTIPVDAVLETIETELGESPSKRFAGFDDKPLATGSVGQAHSATLYDGTAVVVKVRRPGAVEQIDEDLKLLHRLASVLQGRLQAAREIDLVGIVNEFDRSLRAEVDYLHEGHNAERFAENFKQSDRVHIPRIFWEATTSRVLTMERITGMRITDAISLRAAGIQPEAVADNATDIVLKMLLVDGFFHADLHPGNLFVESETRIGLIDFGMVGVVDTEMRAGLEQLLLAADNQDADDLVDALLSLGVAKVEIDRTGLRKDVEELMAKYHGRSMGDAKLGDFLDDVFAVVRSYKLVMPSDLSMLAKTVVTAEGMVGELDPDFQMMNATKPYLRRLVLSQNSPRVWARRFALAAPDMVWVATELPRLMRRFMTSAEKGPFAVAVEAKGVEPHLQRLERIANRVVLAMILSALVVAGAVVVSVYRPGALGGLLDLALGFCAGAAALAGAALMWMETRRPRV